MKLNFKPFLEIKTKIVLLSLTFLFIACTAQSPENIKKASLPIEVDKLLIVDCLLPGQVRRLGQSLTYLTQRRPIKTPAIDCEVRGGEYVSYERIDYKTALSIWLPQAQQNNPEAQLYVGEIYEKGYGLMPDYALAAQWYKKAANQGDSRAQFNLGHLYENGLGVEQDMELAIHWYWKSLGVTESNDILYPKEVLYDLKKQHLLLNQQINVLQASIKKTKKTDLAALQQQLSIKRKQLLIITYRIDKLNRIVKRPPKQVYPSIKPPPKKSPPFSLSKIDNGRQKSRYRALLIGNNSYQFFNSVDSAINNAQSLSKVLKDQYGYTSTVLLNADRRQIINKLSELTGKLTENDNLLIFYAGHSAVNQDICYWLPVDADVKNIKKWLPTTAIAEFLEVMIAGKIIVLADACFDNINSSDLVNPIGKTSPEYWQQVFKQRARKIINTGETRNADFAKAIVAVLKNSKQEKLDDNQFNLQIRKFLNLNEKKGNTPLTLQYGSIKFTGHELGGFFFIKSN